MIENDIRTIVTFTISDDDARDALIDILKNLKFEDAEDQSTMVSEKYIPKTTIQEINEYCKANIHSFAENDILTIYYPYSLKSDSKIISSIKKKDYYYEKDNEAFI